MPLSAYLGSGVGQIPMTYELELGVRSHPDDSDEGHDRCPGVDLMFKN